MKRISTLLIILIIPFALISASDISSYIEIYAGGAFTTNAYSEPLPQNGSVEWLEWRQENPYLTRWDITTSMKYNVFFHESDRTGISLSYTIGFPMAAKEAVPTGDLTSNAWTYTEKDILSLQKLYHSISFGPIFKINLNDFDIGLALRLGGTTLDNFDSLILSLIAEPYFNYIFTNNIYLTVGLNYTGHLMRFIQDSKRIYDQDFTMISIRPYIGMGVAF